MKKAVTLFSLLAMFLVVSCFSNADPEAEVEAETESESGSNALTLADRAGTYVNDVSTVIFILYADGKGTYVYSGKPVIQLFVGSYESTGTTFYASEMKVGIPTSTVAMITFYADNPSEVMYNPNIIATINGHKLTKK